VQEAPGGIARRWRGIDSIGLLRKVWYTDMNSVMRTNLQSASVGRSLEAMLSFFLFLLSQPCTSSAN
jgi:hypothetical protein